MKRLLIFVLLLALVLSWHPGMMAADTVDALAIDYDVRQVPVFLTRYMARTKDFGISFERDVFASESNGRKTFRFWDSGLHGASADGQLYSFSCMEKSASGLPETLLLISCLITSTEDYLATAASDGIYKEQLRANAFLNQLMLSDQDPDHEGVQHTNGQGVFLGIHGYEDSTVFSVQFDLD